MITIIGAGKFGTAISKLLGKNKHALVNTEPDGTYSAESVEKIKQANNIIICVPSQALPDCINMISGIVKKEAKILSCTKGLHENLTTPSELIKKTLPNPTAVLTGPNLSAELELGRPAISVIAGESAHEWTKLFDSQTFKIIVEQDAVGAEFGGAMKNVAALGAGLMEGYFENNACNSMGSVVAFVLKEIEHLYQHKKATKLDSLSFIADLFATSMSENSRNHHYGHLVGEALRKNQPLPPREQTVEGYRTLQIVQNYAEKHQIHVPVIQALYQVFFNKGSVTDVIAKWQ